MITHLLEWLFSAEAVQHEITVEVGHLALRAGKNMKKSLNLSLLPFHIPECRSYTVEYRLSETGEFEVTRDKCGNIGVRSRRDPRHRFPACWLPRSFAGKRVDRYIVMVDQKRVSYRAGEVYRRAS